MNSYVLLALTFAVALLLPFVVRLDRRPWVVVSAFAVVDSFLTAFFRPGSPDYPALSFGAVSVYPRDLVIAVAIGTLVLRLARLPRPPRLILVGLVVIFGVTTLNLLRGLGLFGLETAVNESRVTLALLVGLALGSTLPQANSELAASSRALRAKSEIAAFRWAWVGLAGLAAALWFARALMTGGSGREDLLFGLRALSSSASAVILVGLLSFPLSWPWLRQRILALVAVVLLLVVIVLNEVRASWVAVVTGLASGIFGLPRRWRVIAAACSALALVGLVAFVVFAQVGPALAVRRALAVAFEPGKNTGAWRLRNWRALIDLQVSRGFDAVGIGVPLGTSIERTLKLGYSISVRAHNFLLDLWVDGGLVAVGAFVAMAIPGIWGLVRRAQRDPYALWFLMGSVAVLTFGMAWSLTGSLGSFLGAAFAYGLGDGTASGRDGHPAPVGGS